MSLRPLLAVERWGALAAFAACAATALWLITFILAGTSPGLSVVVTLAQLPAAAALAIAARGFAHRLAAVAGIAALVAAAVLLEDDLSFIASGLIGVGWCLLAIALAGRNVRFSAASVLLLLAGVPAVLGAAGVAAATVVGGVLLLPALAVAGLALATGGEGAVEAA